MEASERPSHVPDAALRVRTIALLPDAKACGIEFDLQPDYYYEDADGPRTSAMDIEAIVPTGYARLHLVVQPGVENHPDLAEYDTLFLSVKEGHCLDWREEIGLVHVVPEIPGKAPAMIVRWNDREADLGTVLPAISVLCRAAQVESLLIQPVGQRESVRDFCKKETRVLTEHGFLVGAEEAVVKPSTLAHMLDTAGETPDPGAQAETPRVETDVISRARSRASRLRQSAAVRLRHPRIHQA
jgi:hypothetical protein